MSRLIQIGFFCFLCFMVLGVSSKTGAQTEFKDTPHFTGMPSYKITDASDQEFADYRFYNGKDCTTIEGKKHYRAYTLKENAKQSSELQISRNYSNSVKSAIHSAHDGFWISVNNALMRQISRLSSTEHHLLYLVIAYGDAMRRPLFPTHRVETPPAFWIRR